MIDDNNREGGMGASIHFNDDAHCALPPLQQHQFNWQPVGIGRKSLNVEFEQHSDCKWNDLLYIHIIYILVLYLSYHLHSCLIDRQRKRWIEREGVGDWRLGKSGWHVGCLSLLQLKPFGVLPRLVFSSKLDKYNLNLCVNCCKRTLEKSLDVVMS